MAFSVACADVPIFVCCFPCEQKLFKDMIKNYPGLPPNTEPEGGEEEPAAEEEEAAADEE